MPYICLSIIPGLDYGKRKCAETQPKLNHLFKVKLGPQEQLLKEKAEALIDILGKKWENFLLKNYQQ